MKDYIEVNSAIALALQGVGEGLKGINFRKDNVTDKLPGWLTMDIGGKSGGGKSGGFSFDLKGELTPSEQGLIRGAVGVLLLIIIYVILTTILVRRNAKENR